MVLSDVSIKRPVFATVMSLLIVLVGLRSFGLLPVREYPDVDNPVVSVSVDYVGATAETIESTIIEPLEQALNGIDDIRNIDSTAAYGNGRVSVEFNPNRDIDEAATDVNNAVQAALGKLPEDAERPVIRKASSGSRALMWLAVRGDGYSPPELTDIADRIVKTPLQVLPGIANIIIGGQRKYAMRIWLDPDKMAARGVDPRDVRNTILANNLQLPAGVIEGAARKFTVLADAQIADPHVFQDLVIRRDADQVIRIRDIAEVELGADNYNTITRYKGRPVVGIGVVKTSVANELAVSDVVRASLPTIRKDLPPGVQIDVAVDGSLFVRESLREVWITLAIAGILVVLVNWFFLRSIAATIIPSITIPVAVIGTFTVMQAAGFSLNVLTLLGLVLAIGLLVDDAIVVLENIYRHQELGEKPLPAAIRGAKEVGFPVLATTVALIAVLLPLSILPGNTGRLFREFSLTVAISVAISTFVALTLVPMMCARFLKHSKSHGKIYLAIERLLDWAQGHYERALRWSVGHTRAIYIFLLVNVLASVGLFMVLPKTLVPTEDRGSFLTIAKAPRGSTLAYTNVTVEKLQAEVAKIPEVEGYFAAIGLAIGGAPKTSEGFMYTRLVPWRERSVKQQDIVASLFPSFLSMPGALAFPINLPSLGQSRQSDLDFILKSSLATLPEFVDVVEEVSARAREIPHPGGNGPALVNLDTDLEVDNPQLEVRFDRDAAADLGLSVRDVLEAMQIALSEGRTNDFILRNKQYDVIPALAPRFRSAPDHIDRIHLRAANGRMVPLSAVVRVVPTVAPAELHHYDLQRSATVTANLAPGATLGYVLDEMDKIAAEVLPKGFSTSLSGASREFRESSAALYLTFAFALLFIYLILSAQFESFIHPMTILFSVPMAVLGALATLVILYYGGGLIGMDTTPFSMNLYSQIGMVLLIGLVTKNSILLVDYANQARAHGKDMLEAIIGAGLTRFRPILMTAVTSILGSLPLAIATGAGGESRRPIGAAVVGGLTFSTIFTLMVIPVVYRLLVELAERFGINTVPPAIELGEFEELPSESSEAPDAGEETATDSGKLE
ncbi:MAG: efflux RND transporter permease subunit [Chrysiogenetes bacterium]|nr:efflux RND transporter permease subunit [Chrysiogenetes bacterium]